MTSSILSMFFKLGLMRDALVFSKRCQRKIPAVKDQSDVSTWLATNKVIILYVNIENTKTLAPVI